MIAKWDSQHISYTVVRKDENHIFKVCNLVLSSKHSASNIYCCSCGGWLLLSLLLLFECISASQNFFCHFPSYYHLPFDYYNSFPNLWRPYVLFFVNLSNLPDCFPLELSVWERGNEIGEKWLDKNCAFISSAIVVIFLIYLFILFSYVYFFSFAMSHIPLPPPSLLFS